MLRPIVVTSQSLTSRSGCKALSELKQSQHPPPQPQATGSRSRRVVGGRPQGVGGTTGTLHHRPESTRRALESTTPRRRSSTAHQCHIMTMEVSPLWDFFRRSKCRLNSCNLSCLVTMVKSHPGITNRRNSRPRNPSVDGSTVGGYNQPSFGAYVPPPTVPAMGYDIMTPAAAAPPPQMAAAPAAPPSIFNPAAAAPSITSPPMMGSYGGGIGADVLAANERKLQYAQGLTAYEPPKSDGFGKISLFRPFSYIMIEKLRVTLLPFLSKNVLFCHLNQSSCKWEKLHNLR